MPEFVLDASVAISWCFPGDPTEDTGYSRRILSAFATLDAVVPEIWAFEITNILFVSFTRRKRISEKQIQDYRTRLKALPIRVEPNDLWTNIELEGLARKLNLAAYDVAYLDLARRKKIPLATRDENLAKAASPAGVEILK